MDGSGDRTPGGHGWDGETPRMSRLRRALLGERSPDSDAAAEVGRSLSAASVLSPIWTTPFDQPPEEPGELDTAALPWELSDDDPDPAG